MKKTMKVLDVLYIVRFVCYLETDTRTGEKEYRLVMLFPGKDSYGYPTKHRKTVGLFEFFGDVLATVHDMYRVYINHKPYNDVISWCEYFDRRKPY